MSYSERLVRFGRADSDAACAARLADAESAIDRMTKKSVSVSFLIVVVVAMARTRPYRARILVTIIYTCMLAIHDARILEFSRRMIWNINGGTNLEQGGMK